jgi:hypothetical protein
MNVEEMELLSRLKKCLQTLHAQESTGFPVSNSGLFNRHRGPIFAFAGEVILSAGRAIPTIGQFLLPISFNELRTADGLLYEMADEVARNGVLQRITSARGFL